MIGQLRSLWEANISKSGATGDDKDEKESESESESESSETDSSVGETPGRYVDSCLQIGLPDLRL